MAKTTITVEEAVLAVGVAILAALRQCPMRQAYDEVVSAVLIAKEP